MHKRYSMAAAMTLGLLLTAFAASLSLAAVPGDFRELVKSAGPAVVNISTERTEQVRSMPAPFDFFRGIPEMDRFFDEFDNHQGKPRTRKSNSLGSGFIISADGYIVTNNHVVEKSDTVWVTIGRRNKDEKLKAEIIGTDPETDLALLKIQASGLPFLTFGNSDTLEVGEWVVAIGSPLGLDHTVTAGIVSAKGRSIQSGPYDDFLQTDASINQGNSGGPLINMSGQVVGINTAIAQRAQGIGFAIPSTMAQRVISDLREHRKVSRGWLGVTIQNVNAAMAKALELKEAEGALVNNVLPGQPADQAGIRAGDVILSINGNKIEDTDHLLRTVGMLSPGSKATVGLWRDGKPVEVILTLAERDAKMAQGGDGDQGKGGKTANQLGLKVRSVSVEDMRRYNLENQDGLLVTGVAQESLAAEAGIMPGDVITAVDRKKVNSAREMTRLIEAGSKAKGVVMLTITRKGNTYFQAIEIKKK